MSATLPSQPAARPILMDMTSYQWTVLFAAWLGWGFDVFDGLLFNYVAPNCVPTLLGLTIGSAQAKTATLYWTGALTSLLLLGWALGGVVFGNVADRIGRTKTLMLTMGLYAVGTGLCAFAPNLWVLALLRFVTSLGIGGEWAAGAAMVAEVVPEKRRVEAGALLYTASPLGLFLATFVNQLIARHWLQAHPELSWRWIFACGIVPALFALFFRVFVHEPERWQGNAAQNAAPKLTELFSPSVRRLTLSGLIPALTVLLMWWSCSAFNPIVATQLAQAAAKAHSLDKLATTALIEDWKTVATSAFNWGGLLGSLLTIPAAKFLGRRGMFGVYFALSAIALMTTFGLDLPPLTRLHLYFFVGLTVFGIFGSFTFYLPELFPTRLRATGAGVCYNSGRIIAAAGPFLVGSIAAQGANSILHTLFWIGVVPLVGLCFLPWIIETKGRALSD